MVFDGIHVECLDTTAGSTMDQAADVDLLSADERVRHTRLTGAAGQRDFAAAHALLRTMLSERCPRDPRVWRFSTVPSGKPRVVIAAHETAPAFSLSHTTGLVACIVSRHSRFSPLDDEITPGVDLEHMSRADRNGPGVGRHCCSDMEFDALLACASGQRGRRFLELWTLKEAYLKAVGTGLAHSLYTVSFAFEGARPCALRLPPLSTRGAGPSGCTHQLITT
jgi:4'-phosphopantetheinyl transferase